MQSYYDIVTDSGNNPISGALVYVYDSLGALATLYSDSLGVTPLSNPVTTDSSGRFIFYAANGIYSAVITAPSYDSKTITGITLNDPAPAPTFTGTGAYVLQTSPTLVTPNLGTPSAVTLTNATGLPINNGTTGTLLVNRGGTGITAFGAGVATALGQSVTGSNGIVLATSATLTTPTLTTPTLRTPLEVATVSATAATGTIPYDLLTQSVLFYTANASNNWTVNFRGDGSTTLNSILSVGQSVTAVFLVTQGSTAYLNNVVQIDGTGASVTTRWQGGVTPTSGNANSVDVYVYSVIKTSASPAYSVFASQTRFA